MTTSIRSCNIIAMTALDSTPAVSSNTPIEVSKEHHRCYQHQESDLSVLTASTDPLSIDGSENSGEDMAESSDDDSYSLIASIRSDEDIQVSITSACSLLKDCDLHHEKSETFTAMSSSSSSSRNDSSLLAKPSHVSFGSICIREYERIAGDHPETTMGVPLGIGWKFYQHPTKPVEDAERKQRKRRRHNPNETTNATTSNAKRIDPLTRKKLLRDVFDVPLEDIRMAESNVKKFRKGVEKRKAQEQKRRQELKAAGLDPNAVLEEEGALTKKGLCKALSKGTKTLRRKLWG